MARGDRPDATEKKARVAQVRGLLAGGAPVADIIDWLTTEVTTADAETRGLDPKPWSVTRQTARVYIDRALEGVLSENAQPRDRKQARTRATLTMIVQRLLAKDTVSSLHAATIALDKIARIDGSYEDAASGGGLFVPATPEETERLIRHAAATLELARARGVMPLPPGPPVIDASSVEVDANGEEIERDVDGGGN